MRECGRELYKSPANLISYNRAIRQSNRGNRRHHGRTMPVLSTSRLGDGEVLRCVRLQHDRRAAAHVRPPLAGVHDRDASLDQQIVLVDFGIARPAHSRTARLYATDDFAAPEQLAGDDVKPSADVYAAAATLYYILSGVSHRRRSADGYALLRARRPALIAIIDKTTSPDADKRYASAREMQRALERLRDGRPAAAPSSTPQGTPTGTAPSAPDTTDGASPGGPGNPAARRRAPAVGCGRRGRPGPLRVDRRGDRGMPTRIHHHHAAGRIQGEPHRRQGAAHRGRRRA